MRRVLPAVAGPTLIVALVVFAMRGFVFRNALTDQHPDVLAFWLPRWCFLGQSLRAGHVPVWDSLQFAGVPFAADPQSGWLYAPVMALFTAFSGSVAGCGTENTNRPPGVNTACALRNAAAGSAMSWIAMHEASRSKLPASQVPETRDALSAR